MRMGRRVKDTRVKDMRVKDRRVTCRGEMKGEMQGWHAGVACRVARGRQ